MKKLILITFLLISLLVISCKKDISINEPTQNQTDSLLNNTENQLVKSSDGNTSHVIKSGIKTNCHEDLLTLLKSSKQYQSDIKGLEAAIIKNGGKGILINIEKSGKLFNFAVLENYSEHTSKISDYIFNTTNNKLFKKDFILDDITEIDYDSEILRKINISCI